MLAPMTAPRTGSFRTLSRLAPAIAALSVLAACAHESGTTGTGGGAVPPPPPPPPTGQVLLDWRAVIRPPELGRLERLNEAWTVALGEARAEHHDAQLRALGDLTDPNAAVDGPPPPPGDYRCRTVKIGSKAQGLKSFTQYGWFACRIEATAKGLKISKTSGSQRPSGLMFPDTSRRMVVLGSISLGEEPAANAYGLHQERDFVGVMERLRGGGWRLAMPWPYAESNLDLIELQH